MRTVTSTLGSIRRLAVLGATIALAACGSSQNWKDKSEYVTVGGTVSGFNGGSLALWNNGKDKLPIAGDGSFKFPLSIANGADYTVLVATQPAGQTCTVANGTGTASGDVKNVAVTCEAYSFTPRPLPAIYETGQAINYSPYRTPEGPRDFEVPSDAEVLEDLGLLHTAGFNLLRLFGAEPPATDVVSEKILRLAAENYPDMKFHLGISLGGLTSCSDTKNDGNISNLISNLAKYPSVVAISVGNETSFFSKFMPLACLESYIRTIRSQVTQPVTTDDDWTFFAGKSSGGGDRVEVKPDTILALIDFVSIHVYPISYTIWDWQQTDVPAGSERARAMMEESLQTAQNWFNDVAAYQYRNAAGATVSVRDSLPIVIGETGWKSVQTNPASEIEQVAALEVNAKWYYDLLYGNAQQGYSAWQGSAGGPPMIFWFEATDEAWKQIDDGWGLWDESRVARYALCGNPAGPACNDDLYAGAGYYDLPPFETITFDSPSVSYTLTGFAGAEDSQVVDDPTGVANKVARVERSATAEPFAGTVVGSAGPLTVGKIPFDAANTRMSVRVYSPAAGTPVRLKVEDTADASRSVETEAVTTVANDWETLVFDFANPVLGTPALNTDYDYARLIIFFNFGTAGATAGAATYYFDDVTFIGGGGIGDGGNFGGIDFNDPALVYTLLGFGGAEDSTLVPDPADAGNTVAQVVKSAAAELWAGTTVSTGPNSTVGVIPFTAMSTQMTVRVYSPRAGIPVRLKVEDAADPDRSVETEALTTVANGWETLTFDFANPAPDTAPLNPAFTYNKLSIFFDFGTSGAEGGGGTFYFDDVTFVEDGGMSGNTGTCFEPCIDFSSESVKYEPFEGLISAAQADDPVDASNKVAKFVKGPTGQPWAGATIYTIEADKSVPEFDLSESKVVTLRVYAPEAGLTVRLKLEDAANNAVFLEQDALTTGAQQWETLSFDFTNPVNGVYDAANTYNRVSVFPAFSTTAPPATELTFYFDELDYSTPADSGDSGNTGTCTGDACIDFSEDGIEFGPFENQGGGTVEITSDPNDAANPVVKFVKKPGDGDFFGTTITGLAGPVVLTATEKTITLRVFSPAVGTNYLLKLEGGSGPATTEVDVASTTAGEWETLSFVMPDTGTYSTVVFFPNGRSSVTAETTMYIDELRFPAIASSADPIVFASGYASNNRTVEGGEWGFYSGNFTDYANTFAGGGFVDEAVAAEDSYIYLVVTTSAPSTDGFMGIFTAAPGYTIAAPNEGVTLTGQTRLQIELGMAAEWFQQADNKQLTVRFIGSQVYDDGSGGSCRILVETPLTPTTADLTAYTIELNSMTLAQPCNGGGFTSGVTTLAEALAKPIGEIHVQAIFPQLNTTVQNAAGTEYPTGFTRGSVSFE